MWRIYHELRRWAKLPKRGIMASKRTEITVETQRTLIIRRSQTQTAWCQECGRDVEVVDVKDAAEFGGTTQPLLLGRMESDTWHLCDKGGKQFICLASLLKST